MPYPAASDIKLRFGSSGSSLRRDEESRNSRNDNDQFLVCLFLNFVPDRATISPKPKTLTIKPVAENRSARHEYFITDELECGIVLSGTEVKALRAGKMQLAGGFARIDHDELWLENVHISAYEHGNNFNHETRRRRKLLAHQREIRKLKVKTQSKGNTLIPVKAYFKGNKVKILIGLAKGKKAYDKRETIKERDVKREMSKE